LLNIDAPHEAVAEMERQMSINEDVLRVLTIRVDELEAGESAILRSRGSRDERRPRGDRSDNRERRDRPPAREASDNRGTPAPKSDSPVKTSSEGDAA